MASQVDSRPPGLASSRRSFLQAMCRAGTVLAAGGLLPSATLAAQRVLPKEALIVRSARPQDLETPAHLLTSWITPNDLFFVRSHFYTPSIQADVWRLR